MMQRALIKRTPKVLVENKVCFSADNSELSIYDTYQSASRVALSSDQLMFCGMITGKKIMHSANANTTFLPHESFVMAPDQKVEIDFPEANINNPTTCLAIEITPRRVLEVADRMNRESPKQKTFGPWQYRQKVLHTHHTVQTQALLSRMVDIFCENGPDRQFLIDLAVDELSARLLRQQTREFIIAYSEQNPEANQINAAVSHILLNLAKPLDMEAICKLACMGRSKFFNEFKKHLGCSPIVFQQQERLKQAARLLEQGCQVTEAGFKVGFQNISHFSTSFRGLFGQCPSSYKQNKIESNH